MRASDRTYATLLNEIQRGKLAPGAVLGEVEQAARLGVSRTPLREAIGRLIADGLAVQVSPRLTVVSDLDPDSVRSLFTVRRALEEAAARVAAENGDHRVFKAIAEKFGLVDLTAAGALDDYYRLIAEFDQALDIAVGNEYLVSALKHVRTHLVRVRSMARDNPDRLKHSVAEHQLIAQAVASGDAELAAHATHVHLHNALTAILESLSIGKS